MLGGQWKAAAAAVISVGALAWACSATAQSLQFAVIGDTPYTDKDATRLRDSIQPKLQDMDLPFVIHLGDFIAGNEDCNPGRIEQRRKQIHGLRNGRVFYTPGDNEWTDCDRPRSQGASLPELERLAFLRRTFFPMPLNIPDSWSHQTQPNFPENARWIVNEVAFATVHLVSTNNGRIEILMDDVDLALSLVEARDEANRVWLETFFGDVKRTAKAVVIATQADVTRPDGDGPCSVDNRMNCDAFAAFRTQLTRLAGVFGKPVLLVHGDTNPYCLDRGFGGEAAGNLWRLNAIGDFHDPTDATLITVDPDNPEAPFSAQGLVGKAEPADPCP